MIRVIIALCLFVITGVNIAVAGEITIAAASDLNFAFKEIVAEYEKTTGNHVKLTLGSSGNFFAQIQNGAPFDLYFSADIAYPKKLEEAGLTRAWIALSLCRRADCLVGRQWVATRSLQGAGDLA